jgi:hypothetical protein
MTHRAPAVFADLPAAGANQISFKFKILRYDGFRDGGRDQNKIRPTT